VGIVNHEDAPTQPETWHYGITARWWAEFNVSGPEIAYFQRFVEDRGGPILDVACGTGRLLIPYLQAGLHVDGCDISSDMLDRCRERATQNGYAPNLYAQAMHELHLPRKYRTIIVCGGFGLGGNRNHDESALRRLYEHLEPDGMLLLDNEVPYSDAVIWGCWPNEERLVLPQPWSPGDRRIGADGTEYELCSRVAAFDPLSQRITREMRASMWRDGTLISEDQYTLKMTFYFTHEVRLMLEAAGFRDIAMRGDYADVEPTGESKFVVFIARKPS
jgi:SAM-dependent methyltransferase